MSSVVVNPVSASAAAAEPAKFVETADIGEIRSHGMLSGMVLGDARWLIPDRVRVRWDLMMAVCIIFVSFWLPLCIGFQIDSYRTDTTWAWCITIFVVFIDLCFILDTASNFFSPYKDVTAGKWVRDYYHIAVHYMKGWFIIDVVSSIPFDLIMKMFDHTTADNEPATDMAYSTKLLRMLRLFKLLKIVRIIQVSGKLQKSFGFGSHWYFTMQLTKTGVYFGAIFHAICCTWMLVVANGPSTDEEIRKHVDVCANRDALLASRTVSEKYLCALYWTAQTLTTVGYGDIQPLSSLERLFNVAMFMLGSGLFAVVSSIVINASQASNKTRSEYRERVFGVVSYLERRKIDPDLVHTVQQFYEERWESKGGVDDKSLLDDLPPELRYSVFADLNLTLIHNIPFLTAAADRETEFHAVILGFLAEMSFMPGDSLYRTGDHAECMFMLARGKVEITFDIELPAENFASRASQQHTNRGELPEDGHTDREKREEAARHAFVGVDEDGSGSLDHGEIRALALSLGVTDEEELAKALEQMDSDGDGDVTQEEFVKWWCAQVDEKADGKKPGLFSRLLVPPMAHFGVEVEEGGYFGETDMVLGIPHAHCAVALVYCETFTISRDDYLDMMQDFPVFKSNVEEHTKEVRLERKNKVEQALNNELRAATTKHNPAAAMWGTAAAVQGSMGSLAGSLAEAKGKSKNRRGSKDSPMAVGPGDQSPGSARKTVAGGARSPNGARAFHSAATLAKENGANRTLGSKKNAGTGAEQRLAHLEEGLEDVRSMLGTMAQALERIEANQALDTSAQDEKKKDITSVVRDREKARKRA